MNKIKNKSINFPRQGEIWLGKFDKIKEISKNLRPVLVISNNLKNEFTDEVIVVTLTSSLLEDIGEYEIFLKNNEPTGLDKASKILVDSIFTLNKDLRLEKKLGTIDNDILFKVIEMIKNSVLSMK